MRNLRGSHKGTFGDLIGVGWPMTCRANAALAQFSYVVSATDLRRQAPTLGEPAFGLLVMATISGLDSRDR